MKINKINEDFQWDIENKFNFLTHYSPFASNKCKEYFDFLKSLNLTNEQYDTLVEIMEDYGSEEYDYGRQDGADQGDEY